MRRSALRLIRIGPRPGWRAQGLIIAGPRAIRVALGRSGVRANKREGDGATPIGRFRPIRLWWRADRLQPPRTALPARRITPDLAWCEDPADRRYNRPFRRSANEPGDRLCRADALYDLIVEIDQNTRPRIAGRGSAVFIHIARHGFAPTQGCVALARSDLQRLLAMIDRNTIIDIHF
jgi:L,D-peptidoglycan transpeptidase YkuD (ErfK/YbiS/YcfS/YnhG family)